MKPFWKVLLFIALFFSTYMAICVCLSLVSGQSIDNVKNIPELFAAWCFIGGFLCFYLSNDMINSFYKRNRIVSRDNNPHNIY